MNTTSLDQFYVIGISVRTTNENGQATKDIPQLWNKFMLENIIVQIPNKVSDNIYCLYTDYESDYTRPYTTILGCKVTDLESIPSGFTGKSIEGNYTTFTATGDLTAGVVFKKWQEIWNTDLPRVYTTDFEIYGSKAQNQTNAEVDIFVGIK